MQRACSDEPHDSVQNIMKYKLYEIIASRIDFIERDAALQI